VLDTKKVQLRKLILIIVCSRGVLASSRQLENDQFKITFSPAGLTSLKRVHEVFDTDYVLGSRSLDDVLVRYRPPGNTAHTLSYMSQMGGWAVEDHALHTARDQVPYLRLGYSSYLSSWVLLISGTADSNYGYWFPGKENDGGAGGGFEPRP
jgi:hypothetical protein